MGGEGILPRMRHGSPARAWIEVNLEQLACNLEELRRRHPGLKMMPVVKANAYGHGLEAVARVWDSCGASFFGVANPGEARRLQQAGVHTRPFILGPAFPEEREEIVANGWSSIVSTFEEARHFSELAGLYGKTASLHLCVDTGMGRAGFLPAEWENMGKTLSRLPHLRIEGIVSHFPAADEDEEFTRAQIAEFERAVDCVREYFPLEYIHIAASAGLLGYAAPSCTMARPGLALYGFPPIDTDLNLKPALRLMSRVTLIRELPAGHGVSYGRAFITNRPVRVATIGIGYADGWLRSLSCKNVMLSIGGVPCPMLGRVTMDQIMADVSNAPEAREGDEVELIGPRAPIGQIAEKAGTIVWEILTGLGPRLPRVYLEG